MLFGFRFVSALLRLMLQIETTNIQHYGIWIPVLEQYVHSDSIPRYVSMSDEVKYATAPRSSISEVRDDDFRVQGFAGVSFSGAPPTGYSTTEYASKPTSGRPRPGRFSISSLREFEVNASLNPQQQYRTNSSITGSVSGSSSVFGMPGTSATSSLFQGSNQAFAPTSSFAESASHPVDDESTRIADMMYDSAEALKSGLRRIAAPTLPPKILAIVRDGGQRIRNRMKTRKFNIRKNIEKSTEKSVASTDDTYASLSSIRDKAGPVDSSEELLVALQRLLESASIPSEQQDEALAMLEEMAKQVEPCCAVNLPVNADSARPLLLSTEGLRPVRLIAESQVANDLIQRQREKDVVSLDSDVTAVSVSGHRTDTGKKASALFYDPFAAQRAKDIKSKIVTEVLWSVGTIGSIVLLLNNPLAVPISYDAVSVLLEGPSHIAYDTSITLPPYSSGFEVLLTVKPLQPGLLTILGVTVCINNAISVIKVDSSGKCIRRPR